MLKNARGSPLRLRLMMMLSRPTLTVLKSPGFARSLPRAAQNHICSKIFSCSFAKTSGEE